MKQKCVRCIVQFSLVELHWEDDGGTAIHLEGAPVFVRVCVLGQLQHSHLHRPVFPVSINQELSFDRILTNCRNPAVFNEVIRGEHVRVELIQVSADYRGGKILARYEAPVHKLLFPEAAVDSGDLREVKLNKSRKYQHPPRLSFSTSTTLLETTVHSPIDSILRGMPGSSASPTERSPPGELPPSSRPSKERETPAGTSDPGSSSMSARSQDSGAGASQRSPHTAFSAKLSGLRASYEQLHTHASPSEPLHHRSAELNPEDHPSTEARLHSLLSSYSQPPPRNEASTQFQESTRPFRVKFKPPLPTFSTANHEGSTLRTTKATQFSTIQCSSSNPHYYKTLPTGLGLHCWHECPRRDTRLETTTSRSAPGSPDIIRERSHRLRSSTLPGRVPVDYLTSLEPTDPVLAPRRTPAPGVRPPFVVRHVDAALLTKRNFCGMDGVQATRHFSKLGLEGVPPIGSGYSQAPVYLNDNQPPPTTASTSASSSVGSQMGIGSTSSHLDRHYPQGSGRQESLLPPTASSAYTQSRFLSSSALGAMSSHFHVPERPPNGPTTFQQGRPLFPTSESLPRTSSCRLGLGLKSSTDWHPHRRGDGDLVSKYLMAQPGNTRRGVASPSKVIEEKLQTMMRECCECKHSCESLGEDSLTEDLGRLRASLAAERDETLNKSARMVPNQSVTVKLGPRDFWSQRMSELTGRSHRDLFGENMEKIYSRLYQEAASSH